MPIDIPALRSHRAYWPSTPREQWLTGFLFVAYIIGAQFGISLYVSPAVLSPAPAVALAGLYLGGLRLWPAIYFGALLVAIINTNSFSWISLAIMPIAYTLQAVVGSYLLTRIGFDPVLRRLSDIFSIMGVAFVAAMIVPTIGMIVRSLNTSLGIPPVNPLTWGSWWTGHILSLLVIAPLIMRWAAKPFFKRTRYQYIETAGVFAALLLLNYLLFWTQFSSIRGISLVYFLLVPLFWSAIRFGPRFTILAVFITSAIGFGGMLYGPYAPAPEMLGNRLFQAEIFFIIIALIFYVVMALQEERRVAMNRLHSYINQLEHALNRLSLQDRAKSDFVAVLAHELRNPLAPIVSSLELLRLTATNESETAKTIDLMDNRLKTIQRLLDDLLDVSRISQLKMRLKKESVPLSAIVEHSIKAIEVPLKTRKQTLTVDFAREPILIDADPVRIEQVISNLLTNASKFTPHGGQLYIATRRDGDMATIRVVDNGIGINPDMLTKIFEPFTQLENGEKTGEGLGIGLSLTQKLVELHGGTIEARSKGANQGSEFVVQLPVVLTPPPVISTASISTPKMQSAPAAAQTGEKVLVVDDNEAAAQGIGTLLRHKGYSVDYAYSGTEAQEKVMSFMPDAVVLDIGLPDADGYEVARAIRKEIGYNGKLIALTGYGQEEDKQRAYDAGFNHHLTKPIGIADLQVVLTSA